MFEKKIINEASEIKNILDNLIKFKVKLPKIKIEPEEKLNDINKIRNIFRDNIYKDVAVKCRKLSQLAEDDKTDSFIEALIQFDKDVKNVFPEDNTKENTETQETGEKPKENTETQETGEKPKENTETQKNISVTSDIQHNDEPVIKVDGENDLGQYF
jgi:cobalamin biosynthesis protein CobT